MKKVRYPNLDDYDLSCYEELKGDILYKINGGTTMSPADQQRMAEAGKCGDKKTQERIISTYETKDNTSTPSGDGGIGPAASAPPSICTTPVQTESPASPTASTSAETNGASTPGSAAASASPEQTASQVSPSSVTPTGSKGVSMTTSTPYSTAPMQTKPPSQTSALDHGQQAEMARMDAESRIGGAGSSASSYSGGGCSGQGGSSSSLDSNSKRSDGSQRYASALTDREQYEMALKDMEEKKSTDNASGSPCGTKVGGSGRIEYDPHNPNRILANLDDKKSLQAAAELLSDPNLGYTVTAYGEKSGCVRNFKNYAEINEYLYRDPNYPGAELFRELTYFHFEGRDARNVITESFEDILSSLQTDGNWKLLSPALSKYHQNGLGTPELKFVCVDGREAVFTNDFSPTGKYELYTDPRYKGTYNYCDPTANPIGHFFADMLPYYLTGEKNERNQ